MSKTEHIKRLTAADLTARYRAILRGDAPPDFFANLSQDAP